MYRLALLTVVICLGFFFGLCDAECEVPICAESLVYLYGDAAACGLCPDSLTGKEKKCVIPGPTPNVEHGERATYYETEKKPKCTCYYGEIYCTKASCEDNGVTYEHGEDIPTSSPCTTCQCDQGASMCLAQTCEPPGCDNPITDPGVCCPTCP